MYNQIKRRSLYLEIDGHRISECTNELKQNMHNELFATFLCICQYLKCFDIYARYDQKDSA